MPIPKMKEHKARLCMALKPVSTRDCGKGLEIIDEATASIDPENEAAVQKAVSALTRGKTLIVIAHRLSTITDADNIVVIRDGEVIAQGRQQELLDTCPLYADMWAAHMGSRDQG